MLPAATKQAGMTAATGPDVCKVPPATPTPFPNLAFCADAIGSTCTSRVKVLNKPVIVEGTQLASSTGDEAGVAMGVLGTVANLVTYKRGVEGVVLEGRRGCVLTSPTAHNGTNANQPIGQQVVPSQTDVFLKG